MVFSQALWTFSATSVWPIWTSIMTPASSSPEGLARSLPASGGALPWIASNMAQCVADIGRGRQPDRTGDLGCDVADDVAVEVRRDDHIEVAGRVGEARRADVDDEWSERISG